MLTAEKARNVQVEVFSKSPEFQELSALIHKAILRGELCLDWKVPENLNLDTVKQVLKHLGYEFYTWSVWDTGEEAPGICIKWWL